MRVFLVRHGQSRANLDWSENRRVADHAIELSEEGHRQAQEAGLFLSEYFAEHLTRKTALEGLLERDPTARRIPKIRLWHSPYQRTRQTAADIVETCRLPHGAATDASEILAKGMSWFLDQREQPLMAEQQFGLFDGLSDSEGDGLDSASSAVAACLSPTPVTVDEIVRQCQVTAPVVHTVLLEMELAGLIERQPGNRIAAI